MHKQSSETLSLRNACAVIIILHISNTIVLGYPTGVGNDSWLAYLASLLGGVPLLLLYARLVHILPGKDLFEMLAFAFGKVATIVISALYAVYFLSLSAVVRNYYAGFVKIVALTNTPLLVILLSFFIICVYLAKSGSETMGKWAALMMVLSIAIAVVMSILSLPKYDFANLMPVFYHDWKDIVLAGIEFVPIPLGEAIIVMTMIGGLEKKANPYKAFLIGGAVSVLFFVCTFLRNLAVLGEKMIDTVNFTSFIAASVIQIGSIGTRIESLIAITFILTGITKVAASLYAGAKSVQHVFCMRDHNPMILSVGLFSVALSTIIFYNMVEMLDFIDTYRIFSVPFQVIIPLALWITAEIQLRKQKIPITKGWKQTQQTEKV